MPLCIISLASVASLAVKREDLGDRLAITVTMILTSITFKTVTQRTLPVISYQTVMDFYILSMFVFIFAVLAANLMFLTPMFEDRWRPLLAYPDDLQDILNMNDPEIERDYAFYFVLFLGIAHVIFLLWLWLAFEINRAWCMEPEIKECKTREGLSSLSYGLQQHRNNSPHRLSSTKKLGVDKGQNQSKAKHQADKPKMDRARARSLNAIWGKIGAFWPRSRPSTPNASPKQSMTNMVSNTANETSRKLSASQAAMEESSPSARIERSTTKSRRVKFST